MSMPQRLIGYADPSLMPETDQQREIVATIQRHGLALHRVHPKRPGVRVSGPGVHVLADSLGALTLSGLASQV